MKSGGSSGLHPTLRKGAKDGAPELLGLIKGGPAANVLLRDGEASLRIHQDGRLAGGWQCDSCHRLLCHNLRGTHQRPRCIGFGIRPVGYCFFLFWGISGMEHGARRALRNRKRCFDERPHLSVVVYSADGEKDWVLGGNPLWFQLHNTGGRIARTIQVEPIRSQLGKFELRFDSIPFSKSGLPPQTLSFRVCEPSAVPLSPQDTQALAILHGVLVGQFTDDRRDTTEQVVYPLTIRYKDGDDEQSQTLHLVFDPIRYFYLRNTDL